jgi:hypothetical protein
LESEEQRLYEAWDNGETGVYVEYLEQQVAKLQAQIAPIERQEEERHAERVREYDRTREPFRRRYRAWQEEGAKVGVMQEANENLETFVERAYSRYDRLFTSKRGSGARAAITLDFEILPPRERTEEHIRTYYREVFSRGRLKRFSQDRLDKMLALPWTSWQKGTAGFYGYMAMTFDTTDKILLECPVEGNAIYVLEPGEQGSLRKGVSKQELLDSGKAEKIIHAGRWYQRLKDELGIE